MKRIMLEELRQQVAGKRWQRKDQLAAYEAVLAVHPQAVFLEVADEHTGCRFGKAQKRAGQCIKVGHAASLYYQAWVSWAQADVDQFETGEQCS